MIVRAFENRDVDAIEDILRSYSMEPNVAPASFVIEEAGSIVATGGMHDMHSRSGWLASVAVAKTHRRRGFGAEIVRANIRRATALGYGSVWLETYFWNVPFYAKLGFEVIKRPLVPTDVLSWRNQKHCCFMANTLLSSTIEV